MSLANLLPLAVLATLTAAAESPQRQETEAQRLHRRGVQCMDEIERADCAIENFEALMRTSTSDRELVTDGMLRLIRLYRRSDDPDAVKPLLRKFWDAGMKRSSRGHVPHSTRFIPGDFDVVLNVDVERLVAAPLSKRLGADARDTLFTCDEARRTVIDDRRRQRRAERKAQATGRDVDAVLAEQSAADRKRESDRKAAQARSNGGKPQATPIMFTGTCPVALALGEDDLSRWRRMTLAFAHADFSRSITFVQIPDLDTKLAAATSGARLVQIAPDHWRVPGTQYEGGDVDVARLDLDELLIAPAGIIGELIAARGSRRPSIDRTLDQLIAHVPRDTGFFLVLTADAMVDLGLGSMKKGARGFLQALLPKPKGMQVAGVIGDDFGLFTRVPTDNAVKGRAMVSIARAMIERRSEADDASAKMLAGLDVAEASDRRALLASYVLSAAQIEALMLD